METTDATRRISAWVSAFNRAMEARDIPGALALFDEACYWRDLIAFTWNLTTAEGKPAIESMLKATLAETAPNSFKADGNASEQDGVTEGWFTFETGVSRGKGYLRLKGDKCWTLLTSMEELKGFEEKKGRRRVFGAEHGIHRDRKSWLERKQEEESQLGTETQPYVVVIGAGQGGLALGARLKRLGVPTVLLEANARPGDSWRKRYKSLCLHDPVWYDHMPYLPFPDDWPVYSPKDKIADWLEMYAKVMELNVWTSTTCEKATFDEASATWTVEVTRDGRPVTLHPKHLVFATGMSGLPNMPTYPGMERFRGEQHHSSQHKSSETFRGKRAVVIGSNNSAHDICADLWENGADVTMVQRTSTHISTSDSLFRFGTSRLYSEAALERGITTDKADLINASIPYGLMHEFHMPTVKAIREHDAELYRRLEKVGFMLDFGDDGSGLHMKYMRRGSGYYIDVGASELIANGDIKLKSGVDVREITETGVVLSDGSELAADLIVYATGYGSMNGWVARLVSPDMADKVGKVWGLGSDTTKDPGPWEGEPRNMWKPTQQEGLWFHGGNLHQSRHYSQYLSLQLKARMEGIPTPVYGKPPVHHRA
ncbi:NAD(P)/FAD-dependent oxidoreductase [Lichenifustis flavocetrariae]|uniref:NAD(P)/FAD-dependent oxidoreductase n=1 Tax=Lichenifustis flavocetrariae TaxID=2949735 RepID=A0AA42CM16_9HYPH|nr:NAD(P)/FAD-dependent oxidoreductase [Lichenifustis flavocetrariae]MCW6507952.1 NAD(P)/FAD-dependent oxidoreductase [Lichenifustis flavocetrariae]